MESIPAQEETRQAYYAAILPDGTAYSLNLAFSPAPSWRFGVAGIADPNLRKADSLARQRVLIEEGGYSVSFFTEGRLNQRKVSGLAYAHYLFPDLDQDFIPFVGIHTGRADWTLEERPLVVIRQRESWQLNDVRLGSSPLIFRSDLSYGYSGASLGVIVAPRDLKGFFVSLELGVNGNWGIQEKRHLYIDPLLLDRNQVISMDSYVKQFLFFQAQPPLPLSGGFVIPWIGYRGVL